jgi:hypothetical protein
MSQHSIKVLPDHSLRADAVRSSLDSHIDRMAIFTFCYRTYKLLVVPSVKNDCRTRSKRRLSLIAAREFEMAASTIEQRALSLFNTFEKSGRTVSRVTIEGRKIELVLSNEQVVDEFEGIDMRYDKT